MGYDLAVTRIAKFFLTFAVVLAVPLQGAAAVYAAQCMVLSYHEMTDEQALDQAQAAQEVTEHDEMTGHGHQEGGSTQGSHHCGPCVGCCASVSIAPSIAFLPAPAPHAAVVEVSFSPHPSVLPDQLDRPPLAL